MTTLIYALRYPRLMLIVLAGKAAAHSAWEWPCGPEGTQADVERRLRGDFSVAVIMPDAQIENTPNMNPDQPQ